MNFGGVWHSDTTYLKQPPMATLLVAAKCRRRRRHHVRQPVLAYETLSEGMRQPLDGLIGVNSSAKAAATQHPRGSHTATAPRPAAATAEHPVVRTHPETGRKALYVNLAHTARFEGMTEEESAPLLNFLFRIDRAGIHLPVPLGSRARWRSGTIAAPSTIAINDYHGQRRVMQRITLAGDTPR